MSSSTPLTVLCLATFFKGNEFIRECRNQGARVVLLTREKLLTADWARDSLDDLIAIPGKLTDQSYLAATAHVMRHRRVKRIVALEEYDVVTAAEIREYAGIPGVGTTTARRFQDKLAMRMAGQKIGIRQPEFVPLLNHEAVADFIQRVPAPWMLKPRFGASAMGIKKLCSPEEIWSTMAELDAREIFEETSAFHLLENYIPGDVYHVDSLVNEGRVVFANVGHYCSPPFEISQFGGVNISHSVRHQSRAERQLLELNQQLLKGFGIDTGVTHAEFLERPGSDHDFYFLEVAARVGGAYTAETIEAATGINLWREWARIELSNPERPYRLPAMRNEYGGLVVSLARQEFSDTSRYDDPEIVYRIDKPWHVGLIVSSPSYDRVMELLEQYSERFTQDFAAVAPPEEKPGQYLS
ncbi:MAG TPA: ATP-grasp domain-containing protein [Pyrinomonadaceae bacterium]|nr:ATP-grasp domain-containing protein [Pyrinomonadaceae bacterium]